METRSSPGRHVQKIQVDKYIYPGKMMGLNRERWDLGQEPFQSTEATLMEVTHT